MKHSSQWKMNMIGNNKISFAKNPFISGPGYNRAFVKWVDLPTRILPWQGVLVTRTMPKIQQDLFMKLWCIEPACSGPIPPQVFSQLPAPWAKFNFLSHLVPSSGQLLSPANSLSLALHKSCPNSIRLPLTSFTISFFVTTRTRISLNRGEQMRTVEKLVWENLIEGIRARLCKGISTPLKLTISFFLITSVF